MQSKKINELGTNVSPSVNDLTVVGDASTGQLKKITLNQIASLFGSVGGVSSVAMTVPTGLTVTGSPITTSGTLAVSLTSGYSIPTTAKQTEWDTGYAERLKWDGGASGLSAPTARTSLGLVIGTDVLAYRTFGTAANNNTGDFATAAQGISADTAYTLRLTGASTPLSISGNIISIVQASTTISGFLSSTDWNTFNAKQAALNGTGFVKATGTTISYDNSTYLTTSSASSTYLPLAGGTLTGALVGTSATFSNILTSSSADQSTSRIVISNTGTGGQSINLVAGNPNTDQTGFSIAYGNTNFLRFNSAGNSNFLYNVGIGTTTPQTALDIINSGTYQLHIATGTGSYSDGRIYFGGLGTGDPYYYGTIGWNQGDVTMRIGAQCGNGTGGIAFYTSGDTSAQTEKARINPTGSLIIGTTTDLGSGYKLQVNGSISMAYANFFNFKGSSGAGDVIVDNSGSSLRVTGAVQLSDAVTFISTALVQGLLTNYNVYNTQTSSYTLVLSDASKVIEMNVGTANTVTIPTNASVAFPIGTEITVMQYGAGVTSIAVASGVTIVSKDSAYTIANRYTGLTLIKRATNEWYIIGNIVV
jgi:hypothetical protein